MRVPRTPTSVGRDAVMKRLFLVVSFTVVVVLGWGSVPADAATPAIQGCYGAGVSALATTSTINGGFGAAVSGFAQDPNSRPGIGDGVQLHQAGLIPDEFLPNFCNDVP